MRGLASSTVLLLIALANDSAAQGPQKDHREKDITKATTSQKTGGGDQVIMGPELKKKPWERPEGIRDTDDLGPTDPKESAVAVAKGKTPSSQSGTPTQPVTKPGKGQQKESADSDANHTWTTIEVFLTLAILVFAAIIAVLVTGVIKSAADPWTPHSVLTIYSLIFIITGALVLITAGFSMQQISPVIGLLGTIAGYLVGSTQMPKPKGKS